jgi:molybdopterin molybdotransferase
MASLGLTSVPCHRRPRVQVITGGDELIEAGEEMRPGAVRNSNAHSVSALVEWSGAEVAGTALVPDRPDATRAAISAALDSDVVVICGGVSVGEHDHVKRALAELDVEEAFWGLALRPGKPTWFGSRGATLVFGLPGNPVSAMVTFILLARPALAAMSGRDPERHRTTARLAEDYEKRPGRAHAVRCRLELREDGWRATPTGAQGSHILTSMLGADCLAMIPTEAGSLSAGDTVQIELLGRD